MTLAREALRSGLLVVGAIHLRYRQDPMDDHGAMRLFNETKRTILKAAHAFSEEPGTVLDDACEMVLASFVLLITAGVSVEAALGVLTAGPQPFGRVSRSLPAHRGVSR
jgi:hypothetical protein